MIIQVGSIYSGVADPINHMGAVAVVRQVCRARPDNFQFMPKYKAGLWDGYIALTRPRHMSQFPTGLLALVQPALEAKGYTIELELLENKPDYMQVIPNSLLGITLRDYQVEAANALLEAGRGVAAMATNSGKTEIMAAISWAMGNHGVLILTLSKELLYQTSERLAKRLGIAVGKIGDGHWDIKPVTVATVQTLQNHKTLDELSKTQCVMVDECHHASSDIVLDQLARIPGYYRFGFSGTPLMYDVLRDMKLMGYTGPVVVEISNKELIRQGYSAKPTIIMLELNQGDDESWGLDFQTAYDQLIVNNELRNRAIVRAAKECKGTVLILVQRISHGQALAGMISGAVFTHGGDTAERRAAILADMATKPGIFIATSIFDEGVDVPAVDRIVMAGGGQSHVKLLQRVGRGLRYKEGRNALSIIDFLDDGNEHLLNHAERRLDTYASQGFKLCKGQATTS